MVSLPAQWKSPQFDDVQTPQSPGHSLQSSSGSQVPSPQVDDCSKQLVERRGCERVVGAPVLSG